MQLAATVGVIFVAVQHLGFLVLEMFLWQTPTGMRIFGLTPERAAESAPLAMNQGLYNGFLAAGLLWGGLVLDEPVRSPVLTFFLACVAVAGLFGGFTAKKSIWVVQMLPALIVLGLHLMSRPPAA